MEMMTFWAKSDYELNKKILDYCSTSYLKEVERTGPSIGGTTNEIRIGVTSKFRPMNPSEVEELVKKEGYKNQTEKELRVGILSIPIEEMGLSSRTQNILSYEGIHTVSDLIRKDADTIMDLRNIGPAALKEINEALGKIGLEPLN